jgi:site-specific recombinase XerD
MSETGIIEPSTEVERLFESAKKHASYAKSENTKKAYRSDWRQFEEWAAEHQVEQLPAKPEAVAAYVVHLAEQGRKPASIERALVAISQAHKLAGFYPSPTSSAAVLETFKGIRRQMKTAQRQAAPLLVEHLRRIVEVLPDNLAGTRDRALLLLGFAGGFRRSELVGLDVEHIASVPEGIVVTLTRSKTDQEGQGRKLGIRFGNNPDTCPVRALRAWLEEASIDSGPLFRSVSRHGTTGSRRLSGKSVAFIVKRSVEIAGYDPKEFSGHSLRAGLATSAARAGKSERVIMATTGHRSEKMVRRYIRDGNLFGDCASEGLL